MRRVEVLFDVGPALGVFSFPRYLAFVAVRWGLQLEFRTFVANKLLDSHASNDVSYVTDAVWYCMLSVRVFDQRYRQEIFTEGCMFLN